MIWERVIERVIERVNNQVRYAFPRRSMGIRNPVFASEVRQPQKMSLRTVF